MSAAVSISPVPTIERWTLHLHADQPLPVLAQPASMLRGIFGHALRELACHCPDQHHQLDCRYARIFEPQPGAEWPARYRNCPPAYVLTAPHTPAGTPRAFTFNLTLLGPACMERDLIWQAWQLAASRGIGPTKIPASLLPGVPEQLHQPVPNTTAVSMRLLSPLLLKRKRHGQPGSSALGPEQVTSTDLLLALHRRLELTHKLYEIPQAPLPCLDEWLSLANGIRLRADLQETHFARRSNRQQKRMPLFGLSGYIHLQGTLTSSLLSALALGQWLHIGGKTALGLGGYQLLAPAYFTVIDGKTSV